MSKNHFINDVKEEVFEELYKIPKKYIRAFKKEWHRYEKEEQNQDSNYLVDVWETTKSFIISQCVVMFGTKYAANVGININKDSEYLIQIKEGKYNKLYKENPSRIYGIFCDMICKNCRISKKDAGKIKRSIMRIITE